MTVVRFDLYFPGYRISPHINATGNLYTPFQYASQCFSALS